MGKSATVIGREFGRNGREMNALLKDHGYLDGLPGAYGLTEKGQPYGEEQYDDNGYGGYAYRGWETRTWNDETAAALKADMKANPGGVEAQESHGEEDAFEYDPHVDLSDADQDADEPRFGWKGLAIAGAVVVGAILVAPHAKSVWDNKVKPAAQKVRARFAKQKPDEAQPSETTGDQE